MDDNVKVDIRFITRKWAPAMGGMETYCVRLTELLSKTHSIDIIALPGKPNGDVPSFWQILLFGLKTTFGLLFVKPASVVHIGDVACWPLGWIASLRHPQSRIMLSAHGSDLNFANGLGLSAKLYAAYLWLGSRLLGGARLIANSEWIAALAKRQGFQNIVKIPLATDIRNDAVPKAHNDSLLFAGRVMNGKGLSFIIEQVLPLLRKPAKIRVAGTVWDEEEGRSLKKANVEYLGVLSPEELAREYGQAACVVVPSLIKEGFGLVAAEAAACGAVVIASDRGGLAEVVTADIGFVAEPGNAEKWASKIDEIRSWSAEKRRNFVEKSSQAARERYSWDRVAKETIAAYDRPISDNNRDTSAQTA